MDYKKKYLKYKLKYLNLTKLYGGTGIKRKRDEKDTGNREKFYEAIVLQQGEKIIEKILIEDKTLVNAKYTSGNTALHIVAKFGTLKIVDLLVKKGADVNIQNEDNKTPLMEAAENGHIEVVNALLEQGADPNTQDAYGNTALMLAIFEGHVVVVNALLERDAVVNIQNEDGNTALMLAIFRGNVAVVNALLERDADVNIQGSGGKTALMLIAENHNLEMLKILYRGNKKPSSIIQNEYGQTALMYAISSAVKGENGEFRQMEEKEVFFINELILYSKKYGRESFEELLLKQDNDLFTAQNYVVVYENFLGINIGSSGIEFLQGLTEDALWETKMESFELRNGLF